MPIRAPDVEEISVNEVRNVSVDMTGKLDNGETLTGTPTVTEDSGDITITNSQVNASSLTINGTAVSAGGAISFTVEPTAKGLYEIVVLCDTTADQTLDGELLLRVI